MNYQEFVVSCYRHFVVMCSLKKKGEVTWAYLVFFIIGLLGLFVVLWIVFKSGGKSDSVVDNLKDVL